MPDKILQINSRQVIHETFDDEIVLVNLETGSYYSLDHVAAAIWQWLGQRVTAAQIQANVAARYVGDRAEMERAVKKFLDELIADGLVQFSDQPAPSDYVFAQTNEPRLEFHAPVLNKYTDMEELLLLDPIHEVDELGWPSAKTEPRE